MNDSNRRFLLNEWVQIKLWTLPVIGVITGTFIPVIGFFVSVVAYGMAYPRFKADPEGERNLKVFVTLGLVLSFIAFIGFIYLLAIGELTESTASLIAHIIKD